MSIATYLLTAAAGMPIGAALTHWIKAPGERRRHEESRNRIIAYGELLDQHESLIKRMKRLQPLVDLGQRRQAAVDKQAKKKASERQELNRAARQRTPAPGTYVIFGPNGCGKTNAAPILKDFFGCTSIVDAWDGETPLGKGQLALTNDTFPRLHQPGVTIMSLDSAMARVASARFLAEKEARRTALLPLHALTTPFTTEEALSELGRDDTAPLRRQLCSELVDAGFKANFSGRAGKSVRIWSRSA